MNNKLLNFLYGIMFGLVSYIVLSICYVLLAKIVVSAFSIYFLLIVLFAYGLTSACVFKSTFPERLIRIATKPISLTAFSLILWPVRNRIFHFFGVVLSDTPADGLMVIMFLLSLTFGTLIGLLIMGVIAAVKKAEK